MWEQGYRRTCINQEIKSRAVIMDIEQLGGSRNLLQSEGRRGRSYRRLPLAFPAWRGRQAHPGSQRVALSRNCLWYQHHVPLSRFLYTAFTGQQAWLAVQGTGGGCAGGEPSAPPPAAAAATALQQATPPR